MLATSFVKITVVLSILRNALGMQNIPPTMVVTGLAAILSIYVMYPVGAEMPEVAEAHSQRAQSLTPVRPRPKRTIAIVGPHRLDRHGADDASGE